MGYPNRDNRSGGRGGGGNYGRNDFGGGRPVRHAEMHKAICSTCGKECEVPFKPSGEKPVYCRDCFAKNRSHEGDRSFNPSPRPEFKRFNEDRPSPAPRNNNELDAINSKLDQILKLLNSNTPQTPKASVETPIEPEVIVKKKRIAKKTVVTEEPPTE